MPVRAIIHSCPPLWRDAGAPEAAAMPDSAGSRQVRDLSESRPAHDPSLRVIAGLGSPKPPKARSGEALTLRERECLMWAAMGKSEWEVSRILGLM